MAFTGTVVITSKLLYWASGIGYIFVSFFSFIAVYTLPNTVFPPTQFICISKMNEIRALTQWVLYTNVEKGMTVSVLGSIFFLLNFLQMLVLFIYAQVKVFDSDVSQC